jgi:hypothetical protein
MSKNEESRDMTAGIRKFVDTDREDDVNLQKLSDDKKVILLAFIGSYAPRKYNPVRSASATIGIVDEFGMEEALRTIQQNTKDLKQKKVYLLINSLGGGVSSSFKIAQAIRDAFEDVTVFVPHIAASGGTLLALTGNKIRMGIMSQLSPVDPQRPYRNEGYVSVNSISRAKKRLDKKFEKQHETEVGYPDRHMAEMIDPVIYEEFFGLRSASVEYLTTMLKKTGYDGDSIEKIKDSLIFNLPIHGFVIDRNLATEIGLKVENDDIDANEWELMREWFAKYVGEESDKHFIRYCIPKIEKTK